jgi:glycosyltransferase involved in cell wall biosynthesis
MTRLRRQPVPAGSGHPAWHVVAVVENVPLGADHRLRKQVETLLDHGCRVTVIGSRDEVNAPYRSRPGLRLLEYPPPREPKGAVGHVWEYAWSGVCAMALLLRVRLRHPVDVVQLCQPPDVYAPLARLLRSLGSRVVVDQRDLMPELLRERFPRAPRRAVSLLHFLERRTQRAVDHTITVNDFLRRRLEAAGGQGRVSVVWNGPVLADAGTASPSPALRAGGDHLIVWVGKMGVQDRAELVVEVADTVVRQLGQTGFRFVLLGDGERLEALQELVRERDLQPWVSFTGWVDTATVFAHLASADLGIDTSLQEEVTPVKALEYMSVGLAFVAFDLPETRQLGLGASVLTPPGDVGALSRALVALALDGERSRRLGEAGRERIRDSLSWEAQEAAYLGAVGPDVARRARATEA